MTRPKTFKLVILNVVKLFISYTETGLFIMMVTVPVIHSLIELTLLGIFFLKMGYSQPLFLYFRLFHSITIGR